MFRKIHTAARTFIVKTRISRYSIDCLRSPTFLEGPPRPRVDENVRGLGDHGHQAPPGLGTQGRHGSADH